MIQLLKAQLLDDAGFPLHGFTTRAGGVSEAPFDSLDLAHNTGDDPEAVRENLRRLRAALKTDLPLLRVDQIHGVEIAEAGSAVPADPSWTSPPAVEADGIVDGNRTGVLAVQVADCAPVLLADPDTRVVAAVHAGWRGAARGALRNAVRAMARLGASLSTTVAAIGPCICASCYEVGEEVARRFPESSDPIPDSPGKHHLDLGLAVEVSLIGAGLSSARIERLGHCSSCREDLYSHRASGGGCGRTLGLISGGDPAETA